MQGQNGPPHHFWRKLHFRRPHRTPCSRADHRMKSRRFYHRGQALRRQTRLDFHDFCYDIDVQFRGRVDSGGRTCNRVGASTAGRIIDFKLHC